MRERAEKPECLADRQAAIVLPVKSLTGLSLAAVLSNAGTTVAQDTGRRPNIVLLYVDDLGYGDLGVTGNPHAVTPNLDRMAGESLVFTSGYAPAALCSPSRAALITGQWPARLHVTNFLPYRNVSRHTEHAGWTLPVQKTAVYPEEVTLPRELKRAGYETLHLGKWHIGEKPSDPVGLGFDRTIGSWPWSWPRSWFSPYGLDTLEDGPEGEYLTNRLTDEAIEFLRKDRDKPFFLCLWYYTPHKPLDAPQEEIQPFIEKGFEEGDKVSPSATYEAMKMVLDRNVGRILSKLGELGIAENTVVVFSSDNGGVPPYSINEPFRGHKKSLHEGGIRVPFFVWWPGTIEPDENDTPVSHMDLMPTFIELASGRTDLPTVDGQSMVPLLLGQDGWDERPLFWHYPHLNFEGQTRIRPQGAVRSGRFKLVLPYVEQEQVELFDVEADPGETRNLVSEHPEVTERMIRALRTHLHEVGAQMPEKNGRFPSWFELSP